MKTAAILTLLLCCHVAAAVVSAGSDGRSGMSKRKKGSRTLFHEKRVLDPFWVLALLPVEVFAVGCVSDPGAGEATWYTVAGVGLGNCTLEFTDADLTTAVSDDLYAGSARCGECLRVSGGAGSAVVKVVDRCPGCGPTSLDLTPTAFQAVVGPLAIGRDAVSFEPVPCPVSGPLEYRFQGSNEFFLKLQVREHRIGVDRVMTQVGGVFEPMQRTVDNHFQLSPRPPATEPINIAIASEAGEIVTDAIPMLINDMVFTGTVQFSQTCEYLLIFSDGFE